VAAGAPVLMVVRRGSYPQVDPRAVGLMTRAIAAAPAGLAVAEAVRLARRRRVRLLVARPAAGRTRAWSAVTPETLERALDLGLADRPIALVLWTLEAVSPETPEVVVRRRLRPGAPGVLVVADGRPVGAVLPDTEGRGGLPGSLAERLAQLPPALVSILRAASEAGADIEVYLVGGLVRDLLLARPATSSDLDLIVEGDAGDLARRLAGRLGGRVREHPTFLTATVELPGRRRLDVATARRERYLRPGALPEVEAGSIREDLWRRDFSLNALAVRLRPDAWGELLDPTGGVEDLRRKEIRILHPLSFVEDPTRILRAGRFATRLGFRLEPATGRLLEEAAKLDCHPALSGDRVRAELGRVLAEPDPEGVLLALGARGGLGLLGRDYRFGRAAAGALDRVRRRTRSLELARPTREGLTVLALTAHGRGALPHAWWERLGLPAGPMAALDQARVDAPRLLDRLARAPEPAAAYAALRGLPELTLAWALVRAGGGSARRHLTAHLGTWRHLRPLLGGDDLRGLGLVPGPPFSALLRGMMEGQVAGRLRTRAQAIRWLETAAGLRRRTRRRPEGMGPSTTVTPEKGGPA
jgi:tRNA nucleotidyltransferase (CCA-adding enzyme)